MVPISRAILYITYTLGFGVFVTAVLMSCVVANSHDIKIFVFVMSFATTNINQCIKYNTKNTKQYIMRGFAVTV